MGEDPKPAPPAASLSRRRLLQVGSAGVAVTAAGVAGVAGFRLLDRPSAVGPGSALVARTEAARPRTGDTVRRALTARPMRVDLGGRQVDTWGFDDAVPTRPIRVTAGDELRVGLDNRLPESTSVHWHGLALRNDMDGVPGLTMDAVKSGETFDYRFVVPDPGTYWFHPHVGAQLDTGLAGALVVDDPTEPGRYDEEVVLLLDDWTDGWASSPQQILERMADEGMAGGMGMGGMEMGEMSGGVTAQKPLGEDTGDVTYPAHLINGRVRSDPDVFETKVGNRVRLRIINAGADTAYRFGVGGHELTVTHTDGFPVLPVVTDSIVVGMGERYDVVVTVQDGAFPMLAEPVGKPGAPALAVLRTGGARLSRLRLPPLGQGRLLSYDDLTAVSRVRLDGREPDRRLDLALTMADGGRRWLINDRPYEEYEPLEVERGERVRLTFDNRSMMFHPMHLHGHTFALARAGGGGPRKDTVNVLPMSKLAVDVRTDNPGQWLLHCHNVYHGELGMMTVMSYVT